MINIVIPIITLVFGIVIGSLLTKNLLDKNTKKEHYDQELKIKGILDAFNTTVISNLVSVNTKELGELSNQLIQRAKDVLNSDIKASNADLEKNKQLINQSIEGIDKKLQDVTKIINDYQQKGEYSFGQVTQSLVNTTTKLNELDVTTAKLKEVLSSSKKRGNWGEKMADDVLQIVGMQEGLNYIRQTRINCEDRVIPDYTILLPKKQKIFMDVKFPFDNYVKLINSDSLEQKETYKSVFFSDVKQKIDQVTKYTLKEETIDFAIMFIPNESIYSFLNENNNEIIGYALTKKVIIASPFTLFAILSIIHRTISIFNISSRTNEITKLIKDFHEQWDKYLDSFKKIGDSIRKTQDAYEETIGVRRTKLEKNVGKIIEISQTIDELDDKPSVIDIESSTTEGTLL